MAIQDHPQPCQMKCLVTENMWQAEKFSSSSSMSILWWCGTHFLWRLHCI